MVRVAIYCRVSTAKQEDNTSLDTQLAACRAKAKENGWQIVAEFREVDSGTALYRKEWGRLIELIRSGGVDVVLAYDLDRLTREQRQLGYLDYDLAKIGGRIELVTSEYENSPEAKAVRSMNAYVAEIERIKLAERTARGRRSRAADRGQWLPGGRAPYGMQFADEGKTKLALDPTTAPYVREIFETVATGGSATGVAKDFNARGIPTPTGRSHHWCRTTVLALIRNPIYTGRASAMRGHWEKVRGKKKDGTIGEIRRYHRVPEAEQIALPDGTAPALIDLDTFNRANAQIAKNRSECVRQSANPEAFLLRAGYVRCGYCGTRMAVDWQTGKNKKPYPVYRCGANKRHGCPSFVIGAPVLDGAVWERVSTVLGDTSYFRQFIDKRVTVKAVAEDIVAIEAHITELKTRAAKLVRLAETLDDDESEELGARIRQLSDQRKRAESDLERKQTELSDLSGRKARFDNLLATVAAAGEYVDALDYQSRRGWLDALGVTATAYAKDHEPQFEIAMDIDPAYWEITDPEIVGVAPKGLAPALSSHAISFG
jgi:site-specific DNA recombinase